MTDNSFDKRVQVHIPYPMLLKRLDEVLDAGINPEVYLDGVYLEKADPVDLESIGREFSSRGLRLTMHGPYMENNPGSSNEGSRLATVGRFRRAFEAAELLRPATIVLHAGYDPRRMEGEDGKRAWLDQSLRTWPWFAEEAERLGLVIAAENIFERNPSTLKALVEAVDSPGFGVCLDAGHLNIFSEVALEEWFRELGAHLAEVHLHDNNGRADEHLPVGEGSVDFVQFFSLMKRYSKGPVLTIEQHGEEMVRRGIEAVGAFLD